MALALCVFMAGCSGAGASSSTAAASVAATVQGQTITEDEVTAYIESFRSGMQYTNDDAWASYLAEVNMTGKDLRESTITELAVPIIIKAKADDLGIAVDESTIDSEISAMRSSLLVENDEAWQNELARYGMTEEQLRKNIGNRVLEEQVLDQVASDVTASDDEIASYITANLTGVTTKKVACVYGTNYDYVQNALAAITGASSAAEGMSALKEHPQEIGVEYADVGWDINAELTSRMLNVVEHLDKGQLADAPLGEGGIYYLFYIEDTYTFPSDGSAADLSDTSLKQAVSDLASTTLKDAAGNAWLQQQLDEQVVVNDMPSGLSYDVTPKASTSASASTSEASENTTSTSGA